MTRAELAALLLSAEGEPQRLSLLREHASLADVSLARTLKDVCLDAWSGEPARAVSAAESLRALAGVNTSEEVAAYVAWTDGIASLVGGRMERAVARLGEAEARFNALNQPGEGAATQVSKLIALAMLGRYDEAVEAGLRARERFLLDGDLAAAGKIENNVGNIYFRRGRYREAEEFQRAAREHLRAAGDPRLLAKLDNCLANTYAHLLDFRSAELLYAESLRSAEAAGLTVTLAEIEGNMGNLALFQGRYDRALDLLERSRRRYAALGMPHQSAIAEMELADAYLELNLATEAAGIYESVRSTFAGLGMRAERARALANAGRARLILGRTREAHELLDEARALYADEGNVVGEAYVTLTKAQLHRAQGDHETAALLAAQAEAPLARAGAWLHLLAARWLRADAARALGQRQLARQLLEAALRDAEEQALPQIAERCHVSLGLLAASGGEARRAEESFKRAVALTEELRAPLPAEEFRTAFVSDRLTPYVELARICLGSPDGSRVEEAFLYVERARSRALVELMSGALDARTRVRDQFEAELFDELERLREELNWFYNQIERLPESEHEGGAGSIETLNDAVKEREARTLEIMRRLQQHGCQTPSHVAPPDLAALRRALGADTALVEYASLDGELLAFVVTNERIEVVRGLAREAEVDAALGGFRFQTDALRYGSSLVRAHSEQLAARARHYLSALHGLLIRPLEGQLGARRMVVVPHGQLHYVPFHALHDGHGYLIERREVSYAPSAGVLLRCLERPAGNVERGLLLGVTDAQTKHVADEIKTLAPLFPHATALLNGEATSAALRTHAPHADVLHLACHGRFRPDNPLFSSLKLGDGWLTARDAYSLEVGASLVVLSACETGANAVSPGDELLGLTRGFFYAGAATLLLSLWTVDDEATANLMADFYAALLSGSRPAAALRSAQLKQMRERPHPFFWSPFVLVGRW